MLRPATPLSTLFFVAFCLLLLSTLSTPIIKGIPLATYRGINFGVLGYCENDKCSGPMIGYDTETLFADSPSTDFSLPAASRHALSSILIVHPVAALMTLICFGLAVAAHFHSPAHSPRYLLALLIFTFPTLLVSLLAFLVDILLFVPHVAWGGWIVLAATILIVASWIVTCAMRRTLVSRKARKKRIAENDEMNGQAYYANRANSSTVATEYPKAESPPPFAGDGAMSGSTRNEYASFELQKQNSSPESTEDTTPLNQRNPSLNTNSSNGRDGSDTMAPMRGPSGRGRQPVDQYGNPIPPMPIDNYVMQAPPRGGPPNRGGPYRGRGGPMPRGGPYGGPRGGYGPGPGPRGGMRGPPPPGWNGNGRGGMRPGPGGQTPGPGPMGRGAPPPGYNNNNFYGQGPPPPREASPYGARGVSPVAPLPMPIGQAIEMDARNGTPPAHQTTFGLKDSDDDIQGMLALQQQGGFPAHSPQRQPSSLTSPTSAYSTEEPQQQSQQYIPVRSAWDPTQNNSSNMGLAPINTSGGGSGNNSRSLSPIQDSPVELSTQHPPVGAGASPSISRNIEPSSDYYEDVDPKFAEPARNNPPPPMPASLMPGNVGNTGNYPHAFLSAPHQGRGNTSDPNLPRSSSFDDLPEGARSPAISDASHYTSVSQRPVNPAWRPEMGAAAGSYGPYNPNNGGGRGGFGNGPMRHEDVVLQANAANPDFAIPGVGRGRGRGRGGIGRGRGGMGGMRQGPPPATMMGPNAGLGAQGRYPGANAM